MTADWGRMGRERKRQRHTERGDRGERETETHREG